MIDYVHCPGHGSRLTGMKWTWWKLLCRIHGIRFHYVKYNRPPYKDGWKVQSIDDEVKDAVALLNTVQKSANTLVVGGHSQGGPVALKAATRCDVDGLAFLMGDPNAQEDCEYQLRAIGLSLAELREQKETVRRKSHGRNMYYTPKFFDDYLKWDIEELARKIDVPVFVLAGTKDHFNTPEKLKRLQKQFKQSTYVEITAIHPLTLLSIWKIVRKMKKWMRKLFR